jgi:hypothetical protein
VKRLLQLGCLFLFLGAVVLAQNPGPAASDDAARTAAIKLYTSLTDDQKKDAVKEFSDKDRYNETFPATQRKALLVSKLNAEQKALLDEVLRGMTSPYGAKIALEICKQDGGRWLNFFGVPEAGKPFAVRLALHHLTLIYAEFGTEPTKEFGPILMGGNPVGTLYDEEDKLVVELRKVLTEAEQKEVLIKGGANSGTPIGKAGMKIGDLGEKSRELAKKLLAQRLAFFSPDRVKVFEEQVKADGGVESLRIALYNDASKGRADGGNYAWKIGNDRILADWQTVDKNHLHLTVRIKAKS